MVKTVKTRKPVDRPGEQAGQYETGTAANVSQEVCQLNSLQAGGSGGPSPRRGD